MRFIPRLVLGAVLALGVITSAAAATEDGKTPSTAMPLSSMASASITGSEAGSFAYLTLNYPGNGSSGVLTLNYSPADTSLANAVGLNVYQGATLLATANGIGSTAGSNAISFSSMTAGPVLIQVYNYNNGVPMNFQVSLSGVTPAPAAAPSPATAPAPAPATARPAPVAQASGTGSTSSSPIVLTKPESSVIPGSSAGAYQYYTVAYPGDSSTRTITVNFSPNGPDVANALFVNVYQDGNQLVSGQGIDETLPGVLTVNYDSATASPILIQVANYNADSLPSISYTISD